MSSFAKRLLLLIALGGLGAAGLHAQAPAPDGSVRFLAVGDWGRRGAEHQKETAEQMGKTAAAIGSQFVIATGDNIYNDGVESVRDSLWKYSFEDIYTAPSLQTPWYVALGNHDYKTNPQAEVDYTLFSPRWKMPARYYTVTRPVDAATSVEFFVLDTSPLIASYRTSAAYGRNVADQDPQAQLAWLERRLAASQAAWKIVVGHHTIYSSSTTHGNSPDLIRDVQPLLEKYGAQIYLNGHDHDMEAIQHGPVIYLTSGAGSEVRHEMKPQAGSLFANGDVSGFLAGELRPEEFVYRFIDWQGRVLFTGAVPQKAAGVPDRR